MKSALQLTPITTVSAITPISFFFFNDTPTTEIYTLSLHDALPIFGRSRQEPVDHEPLVRREVVDRFLGELPFDARARASDGGLDHLQVARRLLHELAGDRLDVGRRLLQRLPELGSHAIQRGDREYATALECGAEATGRGAAADRGRHVCVHDLDDAVIGDDAPTLRAIQE